MVCFSQGFIGAAIGDMYFMFMYNNMCATYVLSCGVFCRVGGELLVLAEVLLCIKV
jgi:hypothetical protein